MLPAEAAQRLVCSRSYRVVWKAHTFRGFVYAAQPFRCYADAYNAPSIIMGDGDVIIVKLEMFEFDSGHLRLLNGAPLYSC